MASQGRPIKWTPEIQEAIVSALSIGAQYKNAAMYAGISEGTFYNWMNRGEEVERRLSEDEGYELTGEDTIFFEFLKAIREANATNEVYHVNNLHNLAPTNSSISQWILVNRHKYGQPTRIEITGKDGGAIETKDITDPVEKAARIAAMLEIAKKRHADEI